jgi:hypothetical protein
MVVLAFAFQYAQPSFDLMSSCSSGRQNHGRIAANNSHSITMSMQSVVCLTVPTYQDICELHASLLTVISHASDNFPNHRLPSSPNGLSLLAAAFKSLTSSTSFQLKLLSLAFHAIRSATQAKDISQSTCNLPGFSRASLLAFSLSQPP